MKSARGATGRILIIAGALLLLAAASLWWPKSRQPDLSGKWYGSACGTVDLQPSSDGDFHGTYTDTYGGTGRVHVSWIARSQRYEGKGGEGNYRHGYLSFAAPGMDRTIRGVYGANADCEFRPGIPSAEHFEWSSTPPSSLGRLKNLWNVVIAVFKAGSADQEQN